MRSYCLWVEQEAAAMALAIGSASRSCSHVGSALFQGPGQSAVGLTCSQSNWKIKICIHRSSQLKNIEVDRQEGYPLSCVARHVVEQAVHSGCLNFTL